MAEDGAGTPGKRLWGRLGFFRMLMPEALAGRLLILFVLGFAAIQGTNTMLLSDMRWYHRTLGIEEAAMRMTAWAKTLERLPKWERAAWIEDLAGIYAPENAKARALFGYHEQRPDLCRIDSGPARSFTASLERHFREAGMGTRFLVCPMGGNKLPHKDFPQPYMWTALELSDGTWAAVAHKRDHSPEGPWLHRTSGSIVVAVMALVVLALVLRFTGPLRRLAMGAEAFGKNPEFSKPLKEEGSVEVREVAQSFNRMRSRIIAHFEERDRVAAAMAHDLRTPLTRVRLRLERMHPEKERENLALDLSELELFVTRGLEYARSRGTTEEERILDCTAFVGSIVDDARDAGARVRFRLRGDGGDGEQDGTVPILVRARPSCLKRCVNNLLDNALAYGKNVEASVRAEKGAVVLEIADDGPGIPADKFDMVFMPYYRLEGSRNLDFGGLGLGLSIARNMAALCEGTVVLENRPEGGLLAKVVLRGVVQA